MGSIVQDEYEEMLGEIEAQAAKLVIAQETINACEAFSEEIATALRTLAARLMAVAIGGLAGVGKSS